MLPPWPVAAEVPVEDEGMENPKRLRSTADHQWEGVATLAARAPAEGTSVEALPAVA